MSVWIVLGRERERRVPPTSRASAEENYLVTIPTSVISRIKIQFCRFFRDAGRTISTTVHIRGFSGQMFKCQFFQGFRKHRNRLGFEVPVLIIFEFWLFLFILQRPQNLE